jgi:hypothetical protein
MHSPEAFVAGLGKGTGGLMRGVVSGTITSTAAIVGSASKGVAKGVGAVSGDGEFVRLREEKRRVNTASSGGLLSGMVAGGESVFSGFASGITGLVTRPYEEGKKGGALGFMKGIGLGVAGVVTKPILGVTDGLASVVHGISNQVSDAIVIKLARPPRAFERSATDVSDKVLVPLDLASAYAQDFVLKTARKGGYTDGLISHISIDGSTHGAFAHSSAVAQGPGSDPRSSSNSLSSSSSTNLQSTKSTADTKDKDSNSNSKGVEAASDKSSITDGSSVVVSEMYVHVLRKDGFCLGKFSFGEVSHCAFFTDSLSSGVDLVLYQATESAGTSNLNSAFDTPFNINTTPQLLLFGDNALITKLKKTKRTSYIGNTTVPEEQAVVRVKCKSRGAAAKLYSALSVCAPQMGNPSSVLPPDVAIAAALEFSVLPASSSSSSSNTNIASMAPFEDRSDVRTHYQGYRFGTANRIHHSAAPMPEKELLLRAARRLAEPVPSSFNPEESPQEQQKHASLTFARFLDERVWQMVSEWRCAHHQLQSSRCLAVLLINQSETPMQILRAEVHEGRNVVTFGVEATSSPKGGRTDTRGYDEESRTLLGGGGAAVMFAFGFLPTLMDPSHVKVSIVTSAFNATVSTRPNRTLCVAVGGYTVGYLEKSLTDHWAKYVILVS